MKSKLLLGIALACLTSTAALALEIKNGKLLSHKEWATTEADYFANHKKDLLNAKKRLTNKSDEGFIFGELTISPVKGAVGETVTLEGSQKTRLQSTANGTKVYKLSKGMCVANSSIEPRCVVAEDIIEIDANGELTDVNTPEMEAVFKRAGDQPIIIGTAIFKMNDEDQTFEVINVQTAIGFIRIDAKVNKSKA